MSLDSQQFDDFIVLDEDYEHEYEPNDEEILKEAEWIGIQPKLEPQLLWIAKDALKAPLPEPWKPCQLKSNGDIFYLNPETGERMWDHPCDTYFKHLYMTLKNKNNKTEDKPNHRTPNSQVYTHLNHTYDLGQSSTTPSNTRPMRSFSYHEDIKKDTSSFDASLVIDMQLLKLSHDIASLRENVQNHGYNDIDSTYISNSINKIDSIVQKCIHHTPESPSKHKETQTPHSHVYKQQNHDQCNSHYLVLKIEQNSNRLKHINKKLQCVKDQFRNNLSHLTLIREELLGLPGIKNINN